MAAAPQDNPDRLCGPSYQRGFRAGDQDLICSPGCPSRHPSTLPPLGQGEMRSRSGPCTLAAPWMLAQTLPWGHLDRGWCQSPFSCLLLAVGITTPEAFQGCMTWPKSHLTLRHKTALIRILLLQPCVFSHRLLLLPQTCHPYYITFVSPNLLKMVHKSAETVERLTETWTEWPLIWVNVVSMQG